jgi:hypothetical protein
MKDSSAFYEPPPTDPTEPSLAGLMKLAARAEELEKVCAELEAALKVQKGELYYIKTEQLPDMMVEAGLSEFKSISGAEIKVTDFVAGSLPKEADKRAAAFDQLIKEGGIELIKNDVVVSLSRSHHNEAAALADDLRKRGYTVDVHPDVHPQTLMAFVREKLRNGESVDYNTLGCYAGRVVKIKMPEKV